MFTRTVLSQAILSLFIALPLVLLFQNCSGGGSGGGSSSGSGQSNSGWPLKVSGSLTAGGGVDAEQFDLTSDGSQIVFLADREVDGKFELYRVNRDGSSLLKLSAGGNVDSFQLLDTQVVYQAEEAPGQIELFAVALDGANRRKLSGPLTAGGSVQEYQISADQLTAVFRADKDMAGVFELYASALSGTAAPTPLKLHTALSNGHQVSAFKIIGAKAIVQGSLLSSNQEELFAVGLDATGFLKISATNLNGGNGVSKFQSDGTGSVIVYMGDLENAGMNDLYLTSLLGSSQTKLNQTPVFGGQVQDFELTPQGQNVVYLGDLDVFDRNELYQRDVIGLTAPNKLNKPLVSGGNVSRFSTFTAMTIVANAPVLQSGVSFIADADVDDQFELFSTTDLDAIAVKANSGLSSGGDIFQYALSADGQRAAYIADSSQSGDFELFAKPMTSAPAAKIVGVSPSHGIVPPLGFAPDNSRILFVGDMVKLHQRDLWIVNFDGTQPKRISHAKAAQSGIGAYKISGDGHWIAYVGDQETTGTDELFIAPVP